MDTVRLVEKTDKEGKLSLTIPIGRPETLCEVVIILQPVEKARKKWPEGFFERTFGSIQDDTFVRGPQGTFENRAEFE